MHGGTEVLDRLLMLMEDFWKVGTVVKDWNNSVIVPMLKKGNVTSVTIGEELVSWTSLQNQWKE